MEEKMIQGWDKHKDELSENLTIELSLDPDIDMSYEKLIKFMYNTVLKDTSPNSQMWDLDRMTTINDGDYQGTLIFMLPEETYQPETYLSMKVSYGSCSWCDTLMGVMDYTNSVTKKVDGLMTICLHLIQSAKFI